MTNYAKQYIQPGEEGEKFMPYTEVCTHMRVSGKKMRFRFNNNSWRSVQLFREDGTEYSGPITYGEAGIFYEQAEERYYYYPDNPAG